MSENPIVSEDGLCLPNAGIVNLLLEFDDNKVPDTLGTIMEHLLGMLSNVNISDMEHRIATIFNSVSEEKRRMLNRIDLMFHDVSVHKSLFNIPKYRKHRNPKDKTIKKRINGRNPICSQKESEFMDRINHKMPTVIDSTMINSFER